MSDESEKRNGMVAATPRVLGKEDSFGLEPRRRRRMTRRRDWRRGRTTGRGWDPQVLAVTLVILGGGVFGAGVANRFLTTLGPLMSSVVLWAAMAIAVGVAFAAARPTGLLQIRPIDLLWGLAIGSGLRLLQGWVSGASHLPFPGAATLDGSLGVDWWLYQALPAALIAPLLEEFVFRGVILVAVFQILRRSLGAFSAGATALLVSAATFVLLHGVSGSMTLADGIQLFAVGAGCALAVLLCGRIWVAVLIHMTYNILYLMLVLIGVLLA